MKFTLSKSIEILQRTPKVYKTLLSGLSDEYLFSNEGENTWSAFDVVGHLIHGEKTDWISRAQIILGNTSDKTFVPFDRFAQFENSKGRTMDDLLTEFENLREENIKILKAFNLTELDLDKKGIHPHLREVTLKELLSTWTIHDLGHLHQVSRVIVKLYKDEIGPWKQYSGLLKDL